MRHLHCCGVSRATLSDSYICIRQAPSRHYDGAPAPLTAPSSVGNKRHQLLHTPPPHSPATLRHTVYTLREAFPTSMHSARYLLYLSLCLLVSVSHSRTLSLPSTVCMQRSTCPTPRPTPSSPLLFNMSRRLSNLPSGPAMLPRPRSTPWQDTPGSSTGRDT